MNRTLCAVALLALVSGCDAFSAAHAFCAQRDHCLQEENVPGDNDDSDDGDDDVAVCTQTTQSIIDAYAANAEPECREFAAAYETLLRCGSGLDCKDLVENDLDGCEDEQKALNKLQENITEEEIDCESFVF